MFRRIVLWSIAAVYICLPLLLKPATADARLFDRVRARRAAVVVQPAAKAVPDAKVDGKHTAAIKVEVYKDKKGEWRWRATHRNGNIMADSGEGYKRHAAAATAASTLFGDKFPIHDKK